MLFDGNVINLPAVSSASPVTIKIKTNTQVWLSRPFRQVYLLISPIRPVARTDVACGPAGTILRNLQVSAIVARQ